MINLNLKSLLKKAAIAGNLIFVLWMLANGINENFSGIGIVELVATVSLMLLLILNIYLLLH